MYRYSVDNAITYTSEDFVLFKESPFACWMERLTLENRDHGIPPDVGSEAPHDTIDTQDDLADTLRAEGKNVMLVAPHLEESVRRSTTLDAMRKGIDFIVNGQLALGTLSGSANLLMRTSGYSQLGNYLYVPCSTQKKTSVHSALRLCFLADLLHSLQGQLPPQMLLIRGGSAVVPLETEDHIYHYRAVKHRFMSEQQAFRKHKMPDPAESANFGRWSECANEVLKQRALRREEESDAPGLSVTAEPGEPIILQPGYAIPSANLDVPIAYTPQRAVGSDSAYDLDDLERTPAVVLSGASTPSGTLAEQARKLLPESELVSAGAVLIDDALENLAFIGSSNQVPTIGQSALTPRRGEGRGQGLRHERRALVRPPQEPIAQPEITVEEEPSPAVEKYTETSRAPGLKGEQVFADANASMVAPPPSLRNPGPRAMPADGFDAGYTAVAVATADYGQPQLPRSEPPESPTLDPVVASEADQLETELIHPMDSRAFAGDKPSIVDMDDTMPVVDARTPEETTATAETVELATADSVPQSQPAQAQAGSENTRLRDDAAAFTEIFSDKDTYLSDGASVDTFNSSLITSEDDF